LKRSTLHSFSLLAVWVCNFLAKEYWHISCLKNSCEIYYRIAKYPKELKGLRDKENCGEIGFFNFEERCLFASKDEKTWKEAKSKCAGVNFINILIKFLNFENRTFLKLAKTKSSEISV
jgi:hypothetical protein